FILVILCLLVIFQFSKRKHKKMSRTRRLIRVVAVFLLVISLFSVPAVWAALALAILTIGLKGIELSGTVLFKNAPWNRKEMQIIESQEPQNKAFQIAKNPWFGNQKIGGEIYEWDDINLSVVAGDTIIDLC